MFSVSDRAHTLFGIHFYNHFLECSIIMFSITSEIFRKSYAETIDYLCKMLYNMKDNNYL